MTETQPAWHTVSSSAQQALADGTETGIAESLALWTRWWHDLVGGRTSADQADAPHTLTDAPTLCTSG
ncbi:hypothetical protein ACFQ0M_48925 [Kitasatospora aburaviensis]|uniref:Uncharacterized protein n=1 Tax=Kitasatospora aburaviensis TaxID=67265 RepID=A0ABW1F4F3_9ACTN